MYDSSLSCHLLNINRAPDTALGTEDTKSIHVFTLIRKVDMKPILQSQGVSYVQEGGSEWSGQVSQRPTHFNSLHFRVGIC